MTAIIAIQGKNPMKPLLKLIALNKGKGYFKAEQSGDEATIYLYDAIVSDDYWGGVSPETFLKALNEIDAPVIHLRINSPGGDVFAARSIEQAIREHDSKIIAHIDGYAASAASYVAVSCDEVVIADGGFFMIHKAWTIAWGNSDDLLSTAGLLEKIDGTLIKTYVKETGQDAEAVEDWMKAETWFNADESVEYGFADSIAEDKVKNKSDWNLSAYSNAPTVNRIEDEPEESSDDLGNPVYSKQFHDHLKRRAEVISLFN